MVNSFTSAAETAFSTKVVGEVTIFDKNTGEVLLAPKKNAIHPKNMATALARGLAGTAGSQIFKMKLGNQGTYIDGSMSIIFKTPITTGDTADLYNPTYAEIVDDGAVGVGVGNSVTFTNIPTSTQTRVIVTCVISPNEAFDNPLDTNNVGQIEGVSPYFFDELGLFTKAPSEGSTALLDPADELMLSHLIFSPIEHTGNRELVVLYSLTISVS